MVTVQRLRTGWSWVGDDGDRVYTIGEVGERTRSAAIFTPGKTIQKAYNYIP